MVARPVQRRSVLTGLTVSALLPHISYAKDYIDLAWEDLLPVGETVVPNVLQGLFDHDETAPLFSEQPESTGVRADWDGQIVRLPGFIVPIDYNGSAVTSFILVPYVGACIHVPPPPANQLVFVTTPTPYENKGMFEAVSVIGTLGISSVTTHLAQVGYALTADSIEPYRA